MFYIFAIICVVLVIFAIVKYIENERELTEAIKKLRLAESRISNITEQFEQAGITITGLRESIEQERINYSRLEENNRQLEETITEQREIYNRLTESNRTDSEAIGRIRELTESSDNIIRRILEGFEN
ncbi:hypothetical protein ES708_30230 [subsurface metagenome]